VEPHWFKEASRRERGKQTARREIQQDGYERVSWMAFEIAPDRGKAKKIRGDG